MSATPDKLICVVVTAWDEADTLPRCLDSVGGFGDDADLVVSIDDKTVDDSYQVAQRYTPHVAYHTGLPVEPTAEPPGTKSIHSTNSMARLRNDVLDTACRLSQAPFVLWLDADEWIAGGHDEILIAVAEACQNGQTDGLLVRMEDVREDGSLWRVWQNTKVVRRDYRFERRRHEGVFTVQHPREVEAVIRHCKSPNQDHQRLRLAQKLDEAAFLGDWLEFRDARSAYYLGDCLNARGAVPHAERWFAKALELDAPHSPQRGLTAMKLVATRFQTGDGWGAREAAFAGLLADWRRGDLMFDLAQIAARVGQHDEAKLWLRCAALYADAPRPIHEMPNEKVEELPHLVLAGYALEAGDVDGAREHLEIAQSFGRNRPEIHDLQLKIEKAEAGEPAPRVHDNMLVISGAMRTGTTWFCEVMNRLGKFVMEPVIMAERGWYHRADVAGEPECSEDFARACADLVPPLRPRRGNFNDEQAQRLTDLYRRIHDEWPEAIGFKDALPSVAARAYPGARVLLIERDTAAVVASIMRRWGAGPDVTPIREAYPQWWEALLPPTYYELPDDSILRRRYEHAAYNVLQRWIDRHELHELGATYRAVRFEDLTANYYYVVPDVLDWWGFADVEEAYRRILPALKAPPNRPMLATYEWRTLQGIAADVEERAAALPWDEAPPRGGLPS